MWLAHEALGEMHEHFWRWTEALQEYEQAARVTPKGLRRPYDFMRARTGDSTFEEAILAQQQVIELNPYVAQEHWVLALYYAYSRNAESAVTEMREAVGLEPSEALFRLWLAHAEGMAGNSAAALQSLKHAEELEGVSNRPSRLPIWPTRTRKTAVPTKRGGFSSSSKAKCRIGGSKPATGRWRTWP